MFDVTVYFKDGKRKYFINCRVIAFYDRNTIRLTCDPLGDMKELIHHDIAADTIAEIKERLY